ncbi:acyl carrier protein [Streptomyces puniciscabiei]|uniref:Acyl carrier protein n=1 Tax=Streptomyces puniciscabiei TaxID=164348 RepID=A0A542UH10_9ACTN|nr:phosphopantetheine-binding protein [Streptomyces puniciscabiei]TQK98359.1 acyl carrier protein [Streptomyces puniciscabiei]
MYEQFKEVLVVSFQVPEDRITPDASLEDLEFDSLELVELSLALQERFGADVSEEDLIELRRVGPIVEALTTRATKAA